MLEADEICDRIAVIKKGEDRAEGTPSSIKTGVEDQGIVEFEVEGLAVERVEASGGCRRWRRSSSTSETLLRSSRSTASHPGELAASLGSVLAGHQVRKVTVREPTLEDAYVLLVSDMTYVRAAVAPFEMSMKLRSVNPFSNFQLAGFSR